MASSPGKFLYLCLLDLCSFVDFAVPYGTTNCSVRVADLFLSFSLIALFELAGMDAFRCSQIVACVKRSQHTNEMELVRSLGWCGFNLTTLEPWTTGDNPGPSLSTKWLFLVAEV